MPSLAPVRFIPLRGHLTRDKMDICSRERQKTKGAKHTSKGGCNQSRASVLVWVDFLDVAIVTVSVDHTDIIIGKDGT